MNRLFRDCVLATSLSLALSGLAYAHAHLESATPPQGGDVATAPSQLTLTFSEGLNPGFTSVQLAGPDGKTISTDKGTLKPSNDQTLVVPLTSPLASGTYTVNWQALSKDGHKTQGAYHFTVGGK